VARDFKKDVKSFELASKAPKTGLEAFFRP
jgi:hypothetical protein